MLQFYKTLSSGGGRRTSRVPMGGWQVHWQVEGVTESEEGRTDNSTEGLGQKDDERLGGGRKGMSGLGVGWVL